MTRGAGEITGAAGAVTGAAGAEGMTVDEGVPLVVTAVLARPVLESPPWRRLFAVTTVVAAAPAVATLSLLGVTVGVIVKVRVM